MLAALCFATVLALVAGSYITVCYRTLEMSTRTAQDTRSIELAELGMEDALWALNKNEWSGWTITGTTATKTISSLTFDGGATGSVSLKVTNFDGSTGTRTVTVSGTSEDSNGTSTTRTLTSSSSKAPLFVNAVSGVTGRVRFKSAGSADSYNSTQGEYSSQTPGFSAIISSGYPAGSTAGVQLTNAQIKGYVATLGGTPSYSAGAKLLGPKTPLTTKIDTSRISSSPYQPQFEEVVPTGAGTSLSGGTATLGTGATSPRLYYASDLLLSGSQVLTIDGPVVIVVSDDLIISDSAKIRITNNGSLRIHIGDDMSIGGAGIQNDTKLPKNLFVVSTKNPNDKDNEMATSTAFYGVIYTPVNSLTIANSQTIYGAIVAKSVTFNASPVIHYDISLRDHVFDGVVTPFAVSNWRETSAD